MKFRKNLLLSADSYKYSQWNQFPQGTEQVVLYISSRGGIYDRLVYLGTQALIREYLTDPITMEMIDQAEAIITAHGEPFNREGWEYIVKEHGGYLPIEIKAVDEGTVMRLKNVLLTVTNTDPKCYWVPGFLETLILRSIWYPTTVASNSYHSKQIILEYLEKTGTPELIDFKLHDFGCRGVSSRESAGLGGMAHLVNFMGTDTVDGLLAAMEYYDSGICGFSIPAMEHSTVTSWGREHETDSFRNMIKLYGGEGKNVACVSDSYNIYEACEKWGTELKEDVLKSKATVVIRPDSGNPSEVVLNCLRILDKHFGHIVNSKGYRVLNNVRIIQGDGIDHSSIRSILFCMEIAGYSADNVAFGQGGALLQQVNRDTLEFAMKCSAAKINGKWIDVFKDPVTSSMKKSFKGRPVLNKDKDGNFVTNRYETHSDQTDYLVTRFKNGEIMNETNFNEVRARAKELVH
jgi:nicotinamide phosphoribosyltransferase